MKVNQYYPNDYRQRSQYIATVVQASLDGKQIQYKSPSTGLWTNISHPSWDFTAIYYRVKPEPRRFIITLNSNGDPIAVDHAFENHPCNDNCIEVVEEVFTHD